MMIDERQALILDNMDFGFVEFSIKNKYHFAKPYLKYEFEIYEQILGEMIEDGLF